MFSSLCVSLRQGLTMRIRLTSNSQRVSCLLYSDMLSVDGTIYMRLESRDINNKGCVVVWSWHRAVHEQFWRFLLWKWNSRWDLWCTFQVQLSLLCASRKLFPLSAPPSCQSVLRFLPDSSGLCLWTQYLCPQTHALRILILEVMVLGGGWGSWEEIKGTRMEPLWLGLVLRKEPPERALNYFAVWDHREDSCLVTRDWTFTQCRPWPSLWTFHPS